MQKWLAGPRLAKGGKKGEQGQAKRADLLYVEAEPPRFHLSVEQEKRQTMKCT